MLQVADHCKIILRIEIRDQEANSLRTSLLTIADVRKIYQTDYGSLIVANCDTVLSDTFPPFCANLSLLLVDLCFWIRTGFCCISNVKHYVN